MYERGIMMMELLLVIAVAVIIIYLGLEQYRAYYKSMQYDLVSSDVAAIREALNRYYNRQPCDVNGMLQASLGQDVIDQLGTVTNRAPYVDHYHAYIIESASVTKDQKPIYQLEITAQMNDRYQQQFLWLSKRLAATRFMSQIFYWIGLPNNTMAQPKSVLWVMNVSRDQFKNLKNDPTLAERYASHAYCAR